MEGIFTSYEIAENCRLLGRDKDKKGKGISHKKLEELSGIKQSVIARMEKGNTRLQLDTILNVLAPLEKTLAVVSLEVANRQ